MGSAAFEWVVASCCPVNATVEGDRDNIAAINLATVTFELADDTTITTQCLCDQLSDAQI